MDSMELHAESHPSWLKEMAYLVEKRYGWRCSICDSPEELKIHNRSEGHRIEPETPLEDVICMCRRCYDVFHDEDKRIHRVWRIEDARRRNKGKHVSMAPRSNRDKITKTRIIDKRIINSLLVDGKMTNATLSALGLPTGFTDCGGWISRIRGRIISEKAYREAFNGKKVKKRLNTET